MIVAARMYAQLGWPVLPIAPGAKRPLTSRGVYDATTDLNVIDSMWTQHPNANIAVATGTAMNAFVVDVDIRTGGHETLKYLVGQYGDLPITTTQRTGGGGFSYVFKLPQKNRPCRLAGKLGDGIDILGEGRYFVVAPSIHPSGNLYTWERAPWDTVPAQSARWLLELVTRPDDVPGQRGSDDCTPDAYERALKLVDQTPGAISGAGGHRATFIMAQRLVRNLALSESLALSVMEVWNAKCQPPWSQRDLKRKIRQALSRGRFGT